MFPIRIAFLRTISVIGKPVCIRQKAESHSKQRQLGKARFSAKMNGCLDFSICPYSIGYSCFCFRMNQNSIAIGYCNLIFRFLYLNPGIVIPAELICRHPRSAVCRKMISSVIVRRSSPVCRHRRSCNPFLFSVSERNDSPFCSGKQDRKSSALHTQVHISVNHRKRLLFCRQRDFL